MRISNINSDVKFGSFDKKTAQKLLNDAQTPQDKILMKKAIISAGNAKDYTIQYLDYDDEYIVLPPNKNDSEAQSFKDVVDAILHSLKLQKEFDKTKIKYANAYSDEQILNLFTLA